MKTKNYWFFNYHLAIFGKHCLYLSVFSLIFSLILRVNLFTITLPIIPVYVFYIIFQITFIRIDGNAVVKISRLGEQDILLTPPLRIKSWWMYEHQRQFYSSYEISGERKISNRESIVISNIEITDANDCKISFTEKIIYGSRFPNESKHLDVPIDKTQASFRIYRTDKLIEFFNENGLCS